MKSTFVFSPTPKAFKIIQSFQWKNKGYSIAHLKEENNSILLQKQTIFQKKRTFEIKVSPSKENISSISVKQILPESEGQDFEQKLLTEILRLF